MTRDGATTMSRTGAVLMLVLAAGSRGLSGQTTAAKPSPSREAMLEEFLKNEAADLLAR